VPACVTLHNVSQVSFNKLMFRYFRNLSVNQIQVIGQCIQPKFHQWQL